ncbi:MAG TPA: phosphatidate cytidylyltransferase [Bryobacteraceae bacterium]|nr:phosphatidate cytidylyltransferase [Bryobacteraceae bacterium]
MKRVITALFLIPLVVWIALWAPQGAFDAALIVSGVMALYEFFRIAGMRRLRAEIPGALAGLALLLAPEPFVILILISLAAMILALFAADFRDSLPQAAALVLGVLYIFGAWRCAMALRVISPHWLMIALLAVWAGDTAALYVGRAFGRRKMAPVISPGKTWEGAAGSVAGAMAAAGVYAHYLLPAVSFWGVVGVAAAGNVAGQMGDLCESAFKRGAGVKDSGSMLPGHGGWLDRIDSSLFAIPVVYAILRFSPF